MSDKESISHDDTLQTSEERARRDFLRKAGRFAAVTPPAMAFLLGTTLSSRAIAASSGTRPGKGWGNVRPGKGWGDKKHFHTGSGGGKKSGKGKH